MLHLTGKPLNMCPEHCQWMEIVVDTSCSYYMDNCYCRQDTPRCKHETVCQHAYELGRVSGGVE